MAVDLDLILIETEAKNRWSAKATIRLTRNYPMHEDVVMTVYNIVPDGIEIQTPEGWRKKDGYGCGMMFTTAGRLASLELYGSISGTYNSIQPLDFGATPPDTKVVLFFH